MTDQGALTFQERGKQGLAFESEIDAEDICTLCPVYSSDQVLECPQGGPCVLDRPIELTDYR